MEGRDRYKQMKRKDGQEFMRKCMEVKKIGSMVKSKKKENKYGKA